MRYVIALWFKVQEVGYMLVWVNYFKQTECSVLKELSADNSPDTKVKRIKCLLQVNTFEDLFLPPELNLQLFRQP